MPALTPNSSLNVKKKPVQDWYSLDSGILNDGFYRNILSRRYNMCRPEVSVVFPASQEHSLFLLFPGHFDFTQA